MGSYVDPVIFRDVHFVASLLLIIQVMTLHALKEPISMVSRCRPGKSPPRIRVARRTMNTSSKVLATLDAEMVSIISTMENEEDSSIEILGPFPGGSTLNGTSRASRAKETSKPSV